MIESNTFNQSRQTAQPFERVDTEKLAQTAKQIRDEQPHHDYTTADDMRNDLNFRKERVTFHEKKVKGAEGELSQIEEQWTKLTKAIEGAEKLLAKRPALRHDIAHWKEKLANIEAEGATVKKYLLGQRAVLKAAKKAVQPLSDKNPIGFDFEKFERLQAEEEALSQVG